MIEKHMMRKHNNTFSIKYISENWEKMEDLGGKCFFCDMGIKIEKGESNFDCQCGVKYVIDFVSNRYFIQTGQCKCKDKRKLLVWGFIKQ